MIKLQTIAYEGEPAKEIHVNGSQIVYVEEITYIENQMTTTPKQTKTFFGASEGSDITVTPITRRGTLVHLSTDDCFLVANKPSEFQLLIKKEYM